VALHTETRDAVVLACYAVSPRHVFATDVAENPNERPILDSPRLSPLVLSSQTLRKIPSALMCVRMLAAQHLIHQLERLPVHLLGLRVSLVRMMDLQDPGMCRNNIFQSGIARSKKNALGIDGSL